MSEVKATVIVEPTVYLIPQAFGPPLKLIAFQVTPPTPQPVTGGAVDAH